MSGTVSAHLSRAYAAASLAAARLRVFALRAASEGREDMARVFTAAAAAADVHARRFMRVLRGRIGTTEENTGECLHSMLPDLSALYERCLEDPAVQDRKVATEVFDHAGTVTKRIRDWVRQGEPPEGPVHVCQVCGWIAAGGAPERCPVCNAVRSRFRLVET